MKENGHTQRVRENSVARLVKQISRRMEAAMTSQLAGLDVNLRQLENLMALFEDDDLSQVELARRTGEAGYAVSRQIDGLEKRGLIIRKRDPDSRRAHRVLLTDEGRALAERLPSMISYADAVNLELLDEEEKQLLIFLLKKALDF